VTCQIKEVIYEYEREERREERGERGGHTVSKKRVTSDTLASLVYATVLLTIPSLAGFLRVTTSAVIFFCSLLPSLCLSLPFFLNLEVEEVMGKERVSQWVARGGAVITTPVHATRGYLFLVFSLSISPFSLRYLA
jgi:hypothetical protein